MEAIYDKIGEGNDTTREVDPEVLSTLSKLLNIEVEELSRYRLWLFIKNHNSKTRPWKFPLVSARNTGL